MKTDRPRIFISGPMTNGETLPDKVVACNVAVGIATAAELIKAGYTVFCPHLTDLIDKLHSIPYETWIETNIPWIRASEGFLRLPGESSGSDKEQDYAESVDVPVFYSVAAVKAAVPVT